ncbi:hypothetical protein BT63DRAFT_427279 [Microthyrium microscopicum]|uniref:Uncharacterized protein n=1 Tax=Microthyrium microscopicum TaxID=703497 RepID=A0A6A6U3K8_9PEZI|nr:hypothetical protein BT63DRAFT_427279 [Microthyrium microscopicum]
MPPASARGRRSRKDTDLPKPDMSMQDVQDDIHTPTRKRRKVNGLDTNASIQSSSKHRQSTDTEETVDNAALDPDAEEEPHNFADEVIRHLRVASYSAAVVQQYNNSVVDSSAQAFAKIAGRDWTFYVSKLHVGIGRPNARKSIMPDSEDIQGSPAAPGVDIDLGPDQQISRMHAEILFNHDKGTWHLKINGRNGGYLDDKRLERGSITLLHSGHVVNVLGTQMMFLLPGVSPIVHPSIQKQLNAEEEDEDDTETELKAELPLPPPSSSRKSGRNVKYLPAAHPPGSSSRGAGAPSSQNGPGTPLGKFKDVLQPKTKISPSYHRGVMMESTEEIDYSLDVARDIKPPHSYAAMIGQAILSTPEEKATLAKIYEYIKDKYAYFRHSGQGWQNSIRHNLSLSKMFEKVPRRTDEPGKGMKWQIVGEHREEFMKKNMQPSRRARNIGSSTPNSPATMSGPVAQTERLMGAIGEPSSATRKKRLRSITPPLSSYPVATESYTPDRGPQASFLTSGPLAPLPVTNTPPTGPMSLTPSLDRSGSDRGVGNTPGQNRMPPNGMNTASFNSPPTLAMGNTPFEGPPGTHLFTPLPVKSRPLAAVQSTCKAPSFYAKDLFSSPAPFWKFANVGSTPARLPELSPFKAENQGDDTTSPIKISAEAEPAQDKENDKIDEDVQPSSPPLVTAGSNDNDVSPTRTVSRPVSRSVASTSIQPSFAVSVEQGVETQSTEKDAQDSKDDQAPAPEGSATPSRSITVAQESTSPIPTYPKPLPAMLAMNGGGPLGPRVSSYSHPDTEEDEDGDIDLTRGFEKIGSFHQTMQTNGVAR